MFYFEDASKLQLDNILGNFYSDLFSRAIGNEISYRTNSCLLQRSYTMKLAINEKDSRLLQSSVFHDDMQPQGSKPREMEGKSQGRIAGHEANKLYEPFTWT